MTENRYQPTKKIMASGSAFFLLLMTLVCTRPWTLQGNSASGAVETKASVKISAVTDKTGYNLGEKIKVRIQLLNTSSISIPSLTVEAKARYAIHNSTVVPRGIYQKRLTLRGHERRTLESGDIWEVSQNLPTGLYYVDVTLSTQMSSEPLARSRAVTSFAVFRKRLQIETIELDKAFYSPGDTVQARVKLKNLTAKAVSGLRVEFADRHWPWIAGRSGVMASPDDARTMVLSEALDLSAKEHFILDWRETLSVPKVKKPKFYQFAVFIWDKTRQELFDLAFSPRIILRPRNFLGQIPYHRGYVRQAWEQFDFRKARNFYPSHRISKTLEITDERTMYKPGETIVFQGRVINSSLQRWSEVNLEATVTSSRGGGNPQGAIIKGPGNGSG